MADASSPAPSTALERLKAKSAQNQAAQSPPQPAAATSTPPTTPPPAPAAQAPQQAAPAPQTAPTPPTPAPITTALAQPPVSTGEITPALIERASALTIGDRAALMSKPYEALTSEEQALVLAITLGLVITNEETIADAMAAVDSGGGNNFSMPFARLKERNWSVARANIDPHVYEAMPVGDRDYLAIFLGYRAAATIWAGEAPAKGTAGKPPKLSMLLPPPLADPENGLKRTKQMLAIAADIQFRKREQRTMFDEIGRLDCSMHVLCWKPVVGFHLLVVDKFTPCSAFLDAIAPHERKKGPFLFKIDEEVSKRKGPAETESQKKYGEWKNYFPNPAPEVSEAGHKLAGEFQQFVQRDATALTKTLFNFNNGSDYAGTTNRQEIDEILAAYDQIIAQFPRQRGGQK
jgi:hypothetical protein